MAFISQVLKLAAEDVFTARSGARVGVPKVMVILTDGQQSNDNDAVPIQDAMVPLQQLSVQVQVVAIGSQVNHVELRKFVGNEQDILSVQDFNSLFNYSRQAAVKTCNITSRPPPGKTEELKQRRHRRQWERQKSNRFGMAKQQLCTCITPPFLYISLPSLHDYVVKRPNFTFFGGREY